MPGTGPDPDAELWEQLDKRNAAEARGVVTFNSQRTARSSLAASCVSGGGGTGGVRKAVVATATASPHAAAAAGTGCVLPSNPNELKRNPSDTKRYELQQLHDQQSPTKVARLGLAD